MIIKGMPMAKGIAFGKIKVIDNYHTIRNFDKKKSFNKEEEIKKFDFLIFDFNKKFIESSKELSDKKDIFEAFKKLINDDAFLKNIKEKIIKENLFLEEALEFFVNSIKDLFINEKSYFYEKQLDIINLINSMIYTLNSKKVDDYNINVGDIVLLDDISIIDIYAIIKKGIKALLLKNSNNMSHTASILTSLKIPSIISLGNFDIKNGDFVIVDGDSGILLISPNSIEIDRYSKKINEIKFKESKKLNYEIYNKEIFTKDNFKIDIFANINFEEDIDDFSYIDGIGLFRTEFLITKKNQLIDENEQFEIYKSLAKKLEKKPIIIRTFDIGSDKHFIFNQEKEINPSLGNRGIRFLLDNRDFFKMQLRAILRASNFGNIMIMYPFVSILEEVIEANEILDEVKNELKTKNIPFNENIKVGIMLEIPSIVLILDKLVDKVDFFSIGTNDMMQYLYARDRLNQKFSSFYNEEHIEIFRLLKIIFSKTKGKTIGICGNLAQNKEMLKYLIGIGYKNFSIPFKLIPEMKNFISTITLEECKKKIEKFIS